MLIKKQYDRLAALNYARRFSLSRNPKYYNFDEIGGDCTNFISQCVYAGSGVMNFTPTYGWYYTDLNSRTASWTGVEYFYNFMTTNNSVGPHMSVVPPSKIMVGDIIQLGDYTGKFYHSLIVVNAGFFPTINNISVATHSYDAFMRKFNTYEYDVARFLHVDYVTIEK